ncbi:MAG: hydrolase [Coprobacillus sp.]|nr:hydrolase [Coprobacillus sp.]
MNKAIPKINTQLRSHTILVPEVYREATGVLINGKRIKSLVFSTDVAVIANCNADAVIAVYPFTPTIQITEAIISVAQTAVVLNAPTTTEFVQNLADDIDIPVVLTIVSLNEDLEKRMLHTKANIINVSGGKDTVKIVKKLREIDPNFPIIATGGPTEETVREVIQAGANAVTFTPPTNGEIFKGMMEEYRHRYD